MISSRYVPFTKEKSTMDILDWLEKWFQSNCDTEWEHVFGVKIVTLDNPGWFVKIDLADTPLSIKSFIELTIDNGDNDWIICRVHKDMYEGFGDPSKLGKILEIFREWVESNP